MDFYVDPTTQYPQEVTKWPGMNLVMQILEKVFDPTSTHTSAFKDCVIIAIDTEYNPETQQIHQLGLAILDTRHPQSRRMTLARSHPISSYSNPSAATKACTYGHPEPRRPKHRTHPPLNPHNQTQTPQPRETPPGRGTAPEAKSKPSAAPAASTSSRRPRSNR